MNALLKLNPATETCGVCGRTSDCVSSVDTPTYHGESCCICSGNGEKCTCGTQIDERRRQYQMAQITAEINRIKRLERAERDLLDAVALMRRVWTSASTVQERADVLHDVAVFAGLWASTVNAKRLP